MRMNSCVALTAAIVSLGTSGISTIVSAQEEEEVPPVHFPRLVDRSSSAEGFAPAGWIVESQASGDLNGDKLADIVLVLRDTNPANVIDDKDNVRLGNYPLDTNPRILLAAFRLAGGGYRLAMENHTLIRRHERATLDDAYDDAAGVTIARGAFVVPLAFFANAGSWATYQSRATFRYHNRRFELIGFDRMSRMRSTGEEVTVSANYSTGKIEIARGSIENGDLETRMKRLRTARPLGIDEVGDGIDFDPENPSASR